MTFEPDMAILPQPQRALWAELVAVPARYVLYGGTALALRLGHRSSADFDFFAHDPLNHRELESIPFVADGRTIQEGPNERSVLVDRGGSVKISFFGGLAFGRVGAPDRTTDGVLRAASLLDLAGTKIKALLQRIEAKDYRDVAALIEAGTPLVAILGAAQTLFDPTFNHLVAQKALSYFEGGDLASLDDHVRTLLTASAGRDLQVEPLARTSLRLD
ncbi:MAG: nucleotidyl transferase AbiEii/AbiGii toxin family protein [Kofleriaceae bacterium]